MVRSQDSSGTAISNAVNSRVTLSSFLRDSHRLWLSQNGHLDRVGVGRFLWALQRVASVRVRYLSPKMLILVTTVCYVLLHTTEHAEVFRFPFATEIREALAW